METRNWHSRRALIRLLARCQSQSRQIQRWEDEVCAAFFCFISFWLILIALFCLHGAAFHRFGCAVKKFPEAQHKIELRVFDLFRHGRGFAQAFRGSKQITVSRLFQVGRGFHMCPARGGGMPLVFEGERTSLCRVRHRLIRFRRRCFIFCWWKAKVATSEEQD